MGKLIAAGFIVFVWLCQPALALCSGGDDTQAFINRLTSGTVLKLPVGTCHLNTLGYGTANVLIDGHGYTVGDLVVLTNGMHIHVGEVEINSIQSNASGSGYSVNDVITLVGGQSDLTAQVTVNSITAGGHINTFTVTKSGSYTTQPANFTSSGGSGTGATWNNPTWGFSEPSLEVVPITSTDNNPVSQASTNGSGTGATFEVEYTAVPMLNNDQCIIGSGRSATTISTTLTNYNLILLGANNNCIKDVQFDLSTMTNGWAILAYNSNQSTLSSIQFIDTPGAIAFTHGSRNASIDLIRINSCSGGNITQVDPTGGGTMAAILIYGDGTGGLIGSGGGNNTGPGFMNNFIIGCPTTGGNPVAAIIFDGTANSWNNSEIYVNNTDTMLIHEDTPNTGQGPNYDVYTNISQQTPGATIGQGAGFLILAGQEARFSNPWIQHSAADCVYIGANASKVFMNSVSFSACANNAIEVNGTKVMIENGQLFNSNNTNTCAACANLKLDAQANFVEMSFIVNMGGVNTAYDINAGQMTSGTVYSIGNFFSAPTHINDPNHVVTTLP